MTRPSEEAAVSAAVAVAAELGLGDVRPEILGRLSNLLVHLSPHPVVARVATVMGELRGGGTAWLGREVAAIRHLAGRDAVALPATVPPGPYLRDGHALILVGLEHHDPSAFLDPTDVGTSLRRLHDNLRDLPESLPAMGLLAESRAWLDGLAPGPGLGSDALARLRERYERTSTALAGLGLESRPLHGDAHAGNVMATPRGVVWTDFEDVTAGPALWDLACLVARSRVFGAGEGGYDAEWADTAVRAYGARPDDPALDLLVTARTLTVAAWGLAAAGTDRPRLRELSLTRVAWLLGGDAS
ncbi:phosphotransferase family protein [Streptomyces sp. ISL-11]|uniref:phosphotransferase family protein n=1 Tax=Streptomyces sp. ISL-11 TaxID=2819174 RepID=UPI001BEA5AFE|nr:aminoglycoside phosphotransferase family protein [Streptomyces sp. ISL-11]MBT2382181.1 aminoglycoside phosphotransferase family protein [Streptomyces sp. ISL-11]